MFGFNPEGSILDLVGPKGLAAGAPKGEDLKGSAALLDAAPAMGIGCSLGRGMAGLAAGCRQGQVSWWLLAQL